MPHETGAGYAACADIGGTKALLGLVNVHGDILARERYLLGAPRDPAPLAEELAARLRYLAERAGLSWEAAVGIGCSAAVMADVERGVVFFAPNLFGAHRNVPFCAMLQQAADRPTLIEMDAYAAAQGEAWKGVGAGVDYFIYVVIGTGVGAGILMEGRVFRGWRGTAGEFGHTVIDPAGPLCNCGRRGCLEALVSGPAIARRAQTASAEAVFAAARRGDPTAREVVRQTVEYLSIGMVNLLHLLNPRVIALGGGVALGGADLLIAPLREETARRCGDWVDMEGTRIVAAALGEDAALLGVARRVWERGAAE